MARPQLVRRVLYCWIVRVDGSTLEKKSLAAPTDDEKVGTTDAPEGVGRCTPETARATVEC